MPINEANKEAVNTPPITDSAPSTLLDTIEATNATLMATEKTQTCQTLESNEAKYHEIVRRIPPANLMVIETTLKQVTPSHIDALVAAMINLKNLLKEDSFIHHEMFPFSALQAVRTGVEHQ